MSELWKEMARDREISEPEIDASEKINYGPEKEEEKKKNGKTS